MIIKKSFLTFLPLITLILTSCSESYSMNSEYHFNLLRLITASFDFKEKFGSFPRNFQEVGTFVGCGSNRQIPVYPNREEQLIWKPIHCDFSYKIINDRDFVAFCAFDRIGRVADYVDSLSDLGKFAVAKVPIIKRSVCSSGEH